VAVDRASSDLKRYLPDTATGPVGGEIPQLDKQKRGTAPGQGKASSRCHCARRVRPRPRRIRGEFRGGQRGGTRGSNIGSLRVNSEGGFLTVKGSLERGIIERVDAVLFVDVATLNDAECMLRIKQTGFDAMTSIFSVLREKTATLVNL
jgi:hypothetical protein